MEPHCLEKMSDPGPTGGDGRLFGLNSETVGMALSSPPQDRLFAIAAEAGGPHIPALGQGLRDPLEYGIHGVPGRRLSCSGPACHTTGDV